MKKINILFLLLMTTGSLSAQSYYEKRVYNQNSNEDGDLDLKDLCIGRNVVDSDLFTTGDYDFHQLNDTTVNKIVFTRHDGNGVRLVAKDYELLDSQDQPFDAYSNSLLQVKDSSAFILVGKVANNNFYQSQANSGGDVLLLKLDADGNTLAKKRVDLKGDDVAWSIKPSVYNANNYIVCGSVIDSLGISTGFVMEIDNSLNINWLTELDLDISTSDPSSCELYDLVSDGSNVWAVGKIKKVGATNTDGLVVKLSSSNGAYITSRRVFARNTDKEWFRHVEMDGDDLIIAGQIIRGKTTIKRRMLALQYDVSTNSVGNALWLNSGLNEDSGRDIISSSASGSLEYYVVGEAFPTVGNNRGVFYQLDNTFTPQTHKQFGGIRNSGIMAIDIYEVSGLGDFIGMSGFYRGLDNDGYLLKTDFRGDSGCEDSVEVSYQSIDFSTGTLLDSIDTVYTTYNINYSEDTLIDSLICSYDEARQSWKQLNESETMSFNSLLMYPNPLDSPLLMVQISEKRSIRELILRNSTGQVVLKRTVSGDQSKDQLNVGELPSGIYQLTVMMEDEFGHVESLSSRFIIE
ncbi:MAG: T9SS type A sorting domain-containing protein [Fluviicola sp.]